MTKKTQIGGDYTIGYGRPPKSAQYTKGKSGNPSGKRKGSRSVGAILQEVLARKVTVTENGKTRRVPAFDGMVHRAVSDALRGDNGALKLVFALFDRYGGSPETTIKLAVLLAEDLAILAGYAIATGSSSDPVATSPPSPT